jgi:hypothetical protein
MRLLNPRSSRFTRSLNYMIPEYRTNSPRGAKTRIDIVAPSGRPRKSDSRNGRTGSRD